MKSTIVSTLLQRLLVFQKPGSGSKFKIFQRGSDVDCLRAYDSDNYKS